MSNRILLFTGDGKGKTTAALGMALRALGHGMRVCVIQFIKNDATTGEYLFGGTGVSPVTHSCSTGGPPVTYSCSTGVSPVTLKLIQTGRGFVPPETNPQYPEHKRAAADGLHLAEQALSTDQYDLVILDEICVAVARDLLTEQSVIDTVRHARDGQCIVLTGRGATQGLIDLADTVTEMRCIKHAYQAGRKAERGVER